MRLRQFLKLAILPTLCLPLVTTCGPSPTPPPIELGQHPYTRGKGRSQLNYLLFLPQDYAADPGQRWPLMVFLHGIGNRGDTLEELEALKKDGPPMYGVWHYALEHPERFAGVVPIAGGYIHGSDEVPSDICDLKDVPMWVFHGAADDVVLPRQSEVLVEALQACPSNVRFTLYPEASHDQSWKLAYADPELYDWLLAQSLD